MAYKASPQTLARAALARSKMSKKIRARSGETAPLSVTQASKEIKQTVRAKQLAAKSATAYGATKGLAVGGEHGGAGVAQKADTGRVWTPDEVAALNKQRGTEPVKLTPAQMRMAAIKAAAEKSVAKKAKSFDVPIPPNPAETNSVADMLDAHLALHITGAGLKNSMYEEVELDEMDKSQPSSSRGAEGLALGKEAKPVKPKKVKSDALKILLQQIKGKQGVAEEVELEEGKIAKALAVGAMSLASMGAKAHTDTTKSVAQLAAERPALAQRLKDIGATGQVPASDKRAAELQRKQDQEMPASERHAKELKKEEVEQIDERNLENKNKKNNWVRGLGVKAVIRGDVPFDRGHSPLRSGREVLAREDIMNEEPKDAADAGEYDYEGDMAKSQLRSIMHNAKRMHDMLEDNTNLPEWVQSKITLAEDYISTTANYMQGEMNEESEISEEGKIAVTPSEKSLAKYHGNPNKITYGDVIKARIRSAAKKAIEG